MVQGVLRGGHYPPDFFTKAGDVHDDLRNLNGYLKFSELLAECIDTLYQ